MTNLILHNGYGILGLIPNATRKDIEKQTKEIEKLLKIGEIPRYSLDLSHFDSLRDEKNIKEAKQNLLNMDAKILHYFFAIYISSEQEKEIFHQKAQNLYVGEDFSAKTFIEKKNIAIFLYIYMSQNGICVNIRRYLQLWADVLSDENIEKFKRLYKHDDDLGINDSVLNGLDSTIRNKAILLQTKLSDLIKDEQVKVGFIANIIRTFNPRDEVQGLSLYDRNGAIVRLNGIYETFEARLELAKRYAKKSKTREWLNNQIPKGSERDTLRNLANRASGGSYTTSSSESSGWGAIFWWIVIIFILMAIFGR